MALLVSGEAGVTAGAVAGEGAGGGVDIECGGSGFFVGVVGGSGEGEEMVGDDALRLVVNGGLAVSEVRCLTGFRGFGGGFWFSGDGVV